MLKGNVTKGLDAARFFLSLGGYKVAIEELLGTEAYPGTLNLRVNPKEKDAFLKTLKKYSLPGFFFEGKRYFSVTAYKVEIKDTQCLLIVPRMTKHGPDIVEVLSKNKLRTELKLKEGDSVTIKKSF
jgi:riboflavin kinase|tara:strand:+ start:112 stop:492 length:381 start_codon:yes stop_codon:yes gene_type:complete